MTDRMETLSGKLAIRPWGEGDHDTLYCGDTIVSEWALKQIGPTEEQYTDRWSYGRYVSLRYWTAEAEASPEDIKRRAIECLYAGSASVEWGALYSESSGYLGIDDELMVGGHDLLGELSDAVGKYLLLELTIHDGHPRSGDSA